MALASAGLSATFHFRAGPASADLEAINATDLMKGMPSMDLKVGHLNAKKLQLCIKKGSGAARSWTAGLTTSILLPLHSELWSRLLFIKKKYGAGSIKNVSIIKKCYPGMGAVTYAMPGGIHLKAAQNL